MADPSRPAPPPARSLLDLRFWLSVALLALFTVWIVDTYVGATRTQAHAEHVNQALRRLAATERVLESAPPMDPRVAESLRAASEHVASLQAEGLGDPEALAELALNLNALEQQLGPGGERAGMRSTVLQSINRVSESLWERNAANSRALFTAWQRVGWLATSGILSAGLTLLLLHMVRRRSEAAERMGQDLAGALAEAQAARAEALRASAAKTEFLATVSHEIRTPMTAILGTAELLTHTPLSSRQADCVAVINSGGETLLSIINDVLDLSRIEAGRLELHRDPFDVHELMDNLVLLFAGGAESKGLCLSLHADPAVPSRVLGDITRLRQALVNLIGNALKFTETGEIAISYGPDRPGWLRFEVRDTGVGIPQEQQGRIFEAFSQVGSGRRRTAGGTGLGLSITRRLVEAMDGTLSLRSAVGLGSVFAFTVRLPEVEPPAPPPRCGPVVVLGDDFACRAILAQLKAWGVAVDQASSAIEVEELAGARDTPYGLAMIGVSGTTELGERLSALRILRLVPFRAGEDADSFGADGVCVKPVRPSRLARALAEANGATGSPRQKRTVAAEPRRLRVLVVDDNHTNLLVVGEMLKALGCQPELVDSGDRALKRLGEEQYDLVFMDCDMPDPDGLETTRRLRKLDLDRHLPVIGLSGHATEDARQHGLAAGMDDYLSKPVRMAQLQGALERWTPSSE